MDTIELTLTVQDEKTIRARGQGDAEESCEIQPDKLRTDTIGVFENWLSQGRITRRKEFEVFGAHLYRMLFSGDVEKLFDDQLEEARNNKKRLVVRLSFQEKAADLAGLPWEYLYRPDTEVRAGYFLTTNVDLVFSRYMPLAKGRTALEPDENPLRILTVVSKPEDVSPPVAADRIIQAMRTLRDNHQVEVDILDKPTVSNLLDAIEEVRPHVLHFIGYGRYNPDRKEDDIALLESDEKSVRWVSDRDFAGYFTGVSWIPQVVLLHLYETTPVDFNANFARLAPRLIRVNVPAVLAMQYPITNRAAIAFSQAFYRALASGATVDEAVQKARWRITISESGAYDNRVFGTPVYYMRSYGGIIRPVEERAEGAEARSEGLRSVHSPAASNQ